MKHLSLRNKPLGLVLKKLLLRYPKLNKSRCMRLFLFQQLKRMSPQCGVHLKTLKLSLKREQLKKSQPSSVVALEREEQMPWTGVEEAPTEVPKAEQVQMQETLPVSTTERMSLQCGVHLKTLK